MTWQVQAAEQKMVLIAEVQAVILIITLYHTP